MQTLRSHPEHNEANMDFLRRYLTGLFDGISAEKALRDLLGQEEDPRWESVEVRSALTEHRFIVTKKGFFGLASPGVKRGDMLAIMAGSESPWYLRKQEQHHLITGKGWVHGLMWESDTYYKNGWKEGDITEIELR